MTFKFFLIEFEDAREYNLSHILYSCVTAAESWFEDNSLILPNSILVCFFKWKPTTNVLHSQSVAIACV